MLNHFNLINDKMIAQEIKPQFSPLIFDLMNRFANRIVPHNIFPPLLCAAITKEKREEQIVSIPFFFTLKDLLLQNMQVHLLFFFHSIKIKTINIRPIAILFFRQVSILGAMC
jgi:hypothetical protein